MKKLVALALLASTTLGVVACSTSSSTYSDDLAPYSDERTAGHGEAGSAKVQSSAQNSEAVFRKSQSK